MTGSLIRAWLHKHATVLRATLKDNGVLNLSCGLAHLEMKFDTTALLTKVSDLISFVDPSVS